MPLAGEAIRPIRRLISYSSWQQPAAVCLFVVFALFGALKMTVFKVFPRGIGTDWGRNRGVSGVPMGRIGASIGTERGRIGADLPRRPDTPKLSAP